MSSTDFWILPAGLEQRADAFKICGELADLTGQWVDRHPLIYDSDYELYVNAAQKAISLGDSIVTFFRRLDAAFVGIETELRAVASEARELDLQAAAELDALDPTEYNDYSQSGSSTAGAVAPAGEQIYETVWPDATPLADGTPGARLEAPMGYGEIDYSARLPTDFLSPTLWYSAIVEMAGVDDLQVRVAEFIGAGWVEMRCFYHWLDALDIVFEELIDRTEASVTALFGAGTTGHAYWQGLAANSARDYFTELQSALTTARDEVAQAADGFLAYLDGVDNLVVSLSDALTGLSDALFWAAVSAVLGGVTLETVVGGIAGAVGAAAGIGTAIVRANEVRDLFNNAMQILDLLHAIDGVTTTLSDTASGLVIPAMEQTA